MSGPKFFIELRVCNSQRWNAVTEHPLLEPYDYQDARTAEFFALDWLTKPRTAGARVVLTTACGKRVVLQHLHILRDLETMTGCATAVDEDE